MIDGPYGRLRRRRVPKAHTAIATTIKTAIPLRRNAAAAIGPSQTIRRGQSSVAQTVTAGYWLYRRLSE